MKTASLSSLLFVLSALLVACSRDTRETDIKECTIETRHDASQSGGALANETVDERHDAIGGIIAACMEKRGYRHDDGAMTDARCVDDVDYNPYCYMRS